MESILENYSLVLTQMGLYCTVLYCTVLYCICTHTGGADEVVRVCPGRVTVVGHTAHHHHRPPGRAHLPGGGVRYDLNA